jgi:predicted Fe-Mo cluster-binding NifX family protein
MKIAAASDDGFNISEHFGRAPYYVVLTVDNGVIVDKEKRPKTGHHTFAAHEHPKLAAGERHGFDADAQSRHADMADTISDCQILIAGGMGWGAYDAMKKYNIEPIVTDVKNVYQAVFKYMKGKLPNLTERLH